jgi:hypothetical protein
MTPQEQSASALPSASISLPSAEVIKLPSQARNSTASPPFFTVANINKMRCPPGKTEAFFWDAKCGGFGLRPAVDHGSSNTEMRISEQGASR